MSIFSNMVSGIDGFMGTLEGKTSSIFQGAAGGAQNLLQNISHLNPGASGNDSVSFSSEGLQANLDNALSYNWNGQAHTNELVSSSNFGSPGHSYLSFNDIVDGQNNDPKIEW